jgi:uncharacterized protein YoxC
VSKAPPPHYNVNVNWAPARYDASGAEGRLVWLTWETVWENALEITAVWIAVLLTVLIAYVLWVLKDVRRTLQQTELTVSQLRQELESRSKDAAGLMRSVQRLTEEVQVRVDRTGELFDGIAECGRSARQMGGALSHMASAFSDTANQVRHAVHTQQARIAEISEWVGIGWQIWQKWQAAKSSSADKSGAAPAKGED